MGQLDRQRAQLDAERAGTLLFPQHVGCAGTRHGPGGATPHPCAAAPVATVAVRYEYPHPHTERLFVCEAHAVGHPDPRPLTDRDRSVLRRRRAAYRRRPWPRPDRPRGTS